MCDSHKDDKNNKGDEDMTLAEHSERLNNNTQSNSFLKLRHKMQNQMKKKNISYEDILRMTKEAKNDR